MTPQEFLKNETPLNMDDYVDVMSTSYYPFYTFQEFAVPDNWWHSKDYLNLPLDEWYGLILKAIKAGYSVGIGGDVSEPGKLGFQDVCFIPSFDIPAAYINQDAREYRIANDTTDDDHGIHLVGYSRVQGPRLVPDQGFGPLGPLGQARGLLLFPRRLRQAQDADLHRAQGHR